MKKGLIFSFDAAMAIAIIFLVVGLYAFYYSHAITGTEIAESLHHEVTDGMLVGFYLNKTAHDLDMNFFDELPDPAPKNFECDYYRVFLTVPSTKEQALLSDPNHFCRWLE